MAGTNFCPECGEPVDRGSKFCRNCGYSLQQIPNQKKVSISKSIPESIPEPISIPDSEPIYDSDSVSQLEEKYIPDRGIWQMFFQWKGRLNPRRFLLRFLFIWTLFPISFLIPLYFANVYMNVSTRTVEVIFQIVTIVIMISTLSLSVRRCHDMNEPAWHIVILIIPCFYALLKVIFHMIGSMTGDSKIIFFDKDGDYLYTADSGSYHIIQMIFTFIQYIVLGIFAIFRLIFTSGSDDDNEYGYNPTGYMASIPKDSNKILAAIQWIEEDASFAQSTGIIICAAAVFFLVPAFLSVSNKSQTNQSSTQVAVSNQSAAQVSHENVSTQASVQEIPKPQPIVEQPQHPAIQTLTDFHRNITNRNYSAAYSCLSYNFRTHMDFDGWAQGFRTTVSSEAQDIKIYSENSNFIVLTYILKATDNFNGREVVNYFNGTANLIFEDGNWKIDEIINKARN
ncbi:MAG: DUF805 domain-containing protein [Selenomonadaceae bacterium]|nr:DUF805 domain-containing protein [Selenomonadaceae bacterium]